MTDLPERCELINGVIYYFDEKGSESMPVSPNTIHQRISRRTAGAIDSYIAANKKNCEVFNAPYDVKLDDDNIVQPDIMVVCDSTKIDEYRCNGAPDWIIEILSPHNSDHDTVEKLSLYHKSGVREYWIVDPMNEKVLVYPFEEAKATGIFTFDDKITAGIYKNAPEPLVICIKELL